MGRIKILLVEDDRNLSLATQDGLQDVIGGYEVKVARNGEEGLELWRAWHPDLILADVDMPVMDGLSMTEHIRCTDTRTPILFTSVLTAPADVKNGLDHGAANYIKKPFGISELDAYIRACLRTCRGVQEAEENTCRIGNFCFSMREETLTHTPTRGRTSLGYNAAEVLRLLAKHKGETVRRETFYAEVWGDYAESNLNDAVNRLRRAFAADSNVQIHTLKGIGYKLTEKKGGWL